MIISLCLSWFRRKRRNPTNMSAKDNATTCNRTNAPVSTAGLQLMFCVEPNRDSKMSPEAINAEAVVVFVFFHFPKADALLSTDATAGYAAEAETSYPWTKLFSFAVSPTAESHSVRISMVM